MTSQFDYTEVNVTECALGDADGSEYMTLHFWTNTSHLSIVRTGEVTVAPVACDETCVADNITYGGDLYRIPIEFAKQISILTELHWGGDFVIYFVLNVTEKSNGKSVTFAVGNTTVRKYSLITNVSHSSLQEGQSLTYRACLSVRPKAPVNIIVSSEGDQRYVDGDWSSAMTATLLSLNGNATTSLYFDEMKRQNIVVDDLKRPTHVRIHIIHFSSSP